MKSEIAARAPLRMRPVQALLIAEVISTTGSQMTWLALPWFVLVTTGSPSRMSLVIAAEAAGYALFGIPSGSILARLGARRTMLLSDASRGPLMVSIPLLHDAGILSLPLLAAIAFALGVLGTPYGAAQRVVLPEVLGEDETTVSRANALFQGATRTTMLAGPALAGVLIAAIGADNVLVVDAASYAAAFVLVLAFVPASARARSLDDGAGVLAGLRFLLRDPLLRAWSLAFALGDAAWIVIFVAIPALVFAHYDANSKLAGLVLAGFGLGAILGNVASYALLPRVDGLVLIAGGVPFQALPLFVLALPVPASVLALALVVSGAANGIVNPPIHSRFTLRPPPAVRAKAMTASFTFSALAAPVALALAGPALSSFGSRPVLGLCAAAQVAAMALVALGALRGRA